MGIQFSFHCKYKRLPLGGKDRKVYELFKCINDQRWPVKRYYVRSDEWQTITLECRGPLIQGYWNDRLLIEVQDETFTTGRVGLWTISDSVSYFDDLEITALM